MMETRKDEIRDLYAQGYSFEKIATMLEMICSASTVRNVLFKYFPEVIRKRPGTECNIDYFETIDTHLKAYFLGFIAADGCISKAYGRNTPNSHKLTIGLNLKDRIVLERFKEELCWTGIFNERPDTSLTVLCIQNKKLTDDIIKYGLTPRKSLTLGNIVNNVPIGFRNSFILGYFDGDGCATLSQPKGPTGTGFSKKGVPYKKRLTASFLGTLDMIEGIAYEVGLTSAYLYQPSKDKNTYHLQVSKKSELIKLYRYMYKDCPFFLDRKHSKFLESGILNEI